MVIGTRAPSRSGADGLRDAPVESTDPPAQSGRGWSAKIWTGQSGVTNRQRPPPLGSHRLARELRRRHSINLAKGAGEVERVAVADQLGDFAYPHAGRAQQGPRLAQSGPADPCLHGLAGMAREKALRLGLAAARDLRYSGAGERRGDVDRKSTRLNSSH